MGQYYFMRSPRRPGEESVWLEMELGRVSFARAANMNAEKTYVVSERLSSTRLDPGESQRPHS